jgi:hypothetical protein
VRRIVAILAVVGMLLHAFALVRHATVMMAHEFADASAVSGTSSPALQALEADLKALCHIERNAARAQSDGGTAPVSGKSSCPICTGLCAAVALTTPDIQFVSPASPPVAEFELPRDQRVEQHKRIRPPGRGPPSLV